MIKIESRKDQFEERISIGSPENEKNEDDENFESELCWCIEQLELGVRNKNPSKDEAERTSKLIRLLKSEKSSKVKKRQVMRNTFGDYRKKIAAEAKQESSKIKSEPKISSVSETKVKRSVFIRKKEIEDQNDSQYQALDESEKGTEWRFHQSENSFQFSFPEPQEKAAK
ncbi:UPF0488 protein C8orf33 homolog isoform X2 [Rhopilema esculentum]|uniref:UPF0488 protein C8orf33 homolog isoform X2 n=1 Tax=Rhopilema esculentum TaxID=499914 RepID=UPI0031DAF0BF